jgi:hypothetical protein
VAGRTYIADIAHACRPKLQDRFSHRLNLCSACDHHRLWITLSQELGPVELGVSDEMRVDLTGDRCGDYSRNQVLLSRQRAS